MKIRSMDGRRRRGRRRKKKRQRKRSYTEILKKKQSNPTENEQGGYDSSDCKGRKIEKRRETIE